MHFHGLTEQVPQVVTAVTTRKVVTPSMRKGASSRTGSRHTWEIQGVRYAYVSVKKEHFFGIENVWVDQNFRIPMTDKERTILDGFISPRRFGSLSEILGILHDHVGVLDTERLVAYALRYGKASVAKRLGWALEQIKAPQKLS